MLNYLRWITLSPRLRILNHQKWASKIDDYSKIDVFMNFHVLSRQKYLVSDPFKFYEVAKNSNLPEFEFTGLSNFKDISEFCLNWRFFLSKMINSSRFCKNFDMIMSSVDVYFWILQKCRIAMIFLIEKTNWSIFENDYGILKFKVKISIKI